MERQGIKIFKTCDWCGQESDREHTWYGSEKDRKWMCSLCSVRRV